MTEIAESFCGCYHSVEVLVWLSCNRYATQSGGWAFPELWGNHGKRQLGTHSNKLMLGLGTGNQKECC